MKSILIRLSEIERDYGLTRHQLETAVAAGHIVPYDGPLRKKWGQYYRVDIEAYVADNPKNCGNEPRD